jgi:hypothetical protein
MAASRKKRPIDGHVLNQTEVAVNRRVQHEYNLKAEDFETDANTMPSWKRRNGSYTIWFTP